MDNILTNTENAELQWYIIHTHPGYEIKVKDDLLQMIENNSLQELITEVVVPIEEDIAEKNGKKKVVMRKKFPTYVFLKMVYTKQIWYMVANTRGVTGFLGPGGRPLALTQEEIKRMRLEKIEMEDLHVVLGDNVRIVSGALENFIGTVEDINLEREILKVRVSMFGRDTPVELEFAQVEKI